MKQIRLVHFVSCTSIHAYNNNINKKILIQIDNAALIQLYTCTPVRHFSEYRKN
jgi:hypothetical protein